MITTHIHVVLQGIKGGRWQLPRHCTRPRKKKKKEAFDFVRYVRMGFSDHRIWHCCSGQKHKRSLHPRIRRSRSLPELIPSGRLHLGTILVDRGVEISMGITMRSNRLKNNAWVRTERNAFPLLRCRTVAEDYRHFESFSAFDIHLLLDSEEQRSCSMEWSIPTICTHVVDGLFVCLCLWSGSVVPCHLSVDATSIVDWMSTISNSTIDDG